MLDVYFSGIRSDFALDREEGLWRIGVRRDGHCRHVEAVVAGLRLAQSDAGDLVNALVKLYQDNAATLTPDPVHSAFYDSHPPAALRIARLQAFSRMRPA